MNEENENMVEEQEEIWQAPPLPEELAAEKQEPEMSEVGTLGSIFFEPGRTFEDLRRKPRFIFAAVIICIITMAWVFSFQQKIGTERIRSYISEQIDKNPRAASMTPEQKTQAVNMQMTISSVVRYAVPIFVLIGLALGGLFYWLGGKVMGGSITYLQALSVWVYSSFPPAVIYYVANLIVLFLKSADEIEVTAGQKGLVPANPTLFVGGAEMPVLTTLISVFDFFLIWGWILAAIGLHKTGKLTKGSAWAVVLIFALVGITIRVVLALISGNPS
ncbi:MAG: Yip1 family protein [Pyrinomonadaceae bacterium]